MSLSSQLADEEREGEKRGGREERGEEGGKEERREGKRRGGKRGEGWSGGEEGGSEGMERGEKRKVNMCMLACVYLHASRYIVYLCACMYECV